jgi:hypothetical protein
MRGLPKAVAILGDLLLKTHRFTPVHAAYRHALSSRSAIIEAHEVLAMKSRQGYKGYVIVARSCELREGEFSAEFSVEEHEADGFMETEFYLPETFPTQESAIEAGIQAGRQKIDVGFERGSAVVNG